MTGSDLKKALKSLGWSQARLGRSIDVSAGTVSRWVGDRSGQVPGAVAAYVELAMKLKALSDDVLGA